MKEFRFQLLFLSHGFLFFYRTNKTSSSTQGFVGCRRKYLIETFFFFKYSSISDEEELVEFHKVCRHIEVTKQKSFVLTFDSWTNFRMCTLNVNWYCRANHNNFVNIPKQVFSKYSKLLFFVYSFRPECVKKVNCWENINRFFLHCHFRPGVNSVYVPIK